MKKYPMKLKPVLKDYIWGGTSLKKKFNIDSDMQKIAEGWMLSCHKDGENIITNGYYKGKTLSEVLAENTYLLGEKIVKKIGEKSSVEQIRKEFPILIKLIDAEDNLSIQVHPDDEYALRVEGEFGKTEIWYIVDAKPSAYLYYGFAKEISKQEFRERIESDRLLEVLNKVEVKKGDVFFIKSGCLHAICKGIIIAEIQQNSNTTYRIYDYNRKGADGKPRELHIDKAMDVVKLSVPEKPQDFKDRVEEQDYISETIGSCEYFNVKKVDIINKYSFKTTAEKFMNLLVIGGECELFYNSEKMPLKKGDSVFLPAKDMEYQIRGNTEIIFSLP